MMCFVDSNGWLHVNDSNAKIIELGGGAQPQFQPNVDVRQCLNEAGQPTVAFTANFDQPLPIQDEEWDIVFTRYAIEHISWRNVHVFIGELHRILKPGGTAVIVTANAEAQMRWALAQDEWSEKISQCLGGDQDYPDNTHKVFFNPAWISRLCREVGFDRVVVLPHGELGTDMVIQATRF